MPAKERVDASSSGGKTKKKKVEKKKKEEGKIAEAKREEATRSSRNEASPSSGGKQEDKAPMLLAPLNAKHERSVAGFAKKKNGNEGPTSQAQSKVSRRGDGRAPRDTKSDDDGGGG